MGTFISLYHRKESENSNILQFAGGKKIFRWALRESLETAACFGLLNKLSIRSPLSQQVGLPLSSFLYRFSQ